MTIRCEQVSVPRHVSMTALRSIGSTWPRWAYLVALLGEIVGVPISLGLRLNLPTLIVTLADVAAGTCTTFALFTTSAWLLRRRFGGRRLPPYVLAEAVVALGAAVSFGHESSPSLLFAVAVGLALAMPIAFGYAANEWPRAVLPVGVLTCIAFLLIVDRNVAWMFPRWRSNLSTMLSVGMLSSALVTSWIMSPLAEPARVRSTWILAGATVLVAGLAEVTWPDASLRSAALAVRQYELASPLHAGKWWRSMRSGTVFLAPPVDGPTVAPGHGSSVYRLSQPGPQRFDNILFVVIDAARADLFLTADDDLGREYPALAGLVRDGCRYENVHAAAVSTHLALPTLLNGTFEYERLAEPAFKTLSRAMGARQRAFAAPLGTWVPPKYFGVPTEGRESDTDSQMGAEVLDSLQVDARARSRWVYWVHFAQVHLPTSFSYARGLAMTKLLHGTAAVRRRYIDAMRTVDSALGKVFAALKENGQWDRTLVVVTADHGEAMNERGYTLHGTMLYTSTTRVPLLVHSPGAPCADTHRLISSVDLFAMVTSSLGFAVTPPSAEGLWPPIGNRVWITYSRKGFRDFALGDDQMKYIVHDRFGVIEAYDAATDPDELRNIVTRADTAKVKALLKVLPDAAKLRLPASIRDSPP
jgi:Sulfatase